MANVYAIKHNDYTYIINDKPQDSEVYNINRFFMYRMRGKIKDECIYWDEFAFPIYVVFITYQIIGKDEHIVWVYEMDSEDDKTFNVQNTYKYNKDVKLGKHIINIYYSGDNVMSTIKYAEIGSRGMINMNMYLDIDGVLKSKF